jgi:hypothetical protein
MRPLRSPHSILVLAGYALGVGALLSGFPDPVPHVWSAARHEPVWWSGAIAALMLPTAMLVTDALLRGLRVPHPIDERDRAIALAIHDAIMLRFLMFVLGVHVMVLLGMEGLLSGRAWAGRVVPVMLGLTMISIGNLLPRTRPNLAIGIRTRRMLLDRALWIRTHRSTGYMLVVCGVIIVVSALAVPAPVGPGMILLVGPAFLIGACFIVWQGRRSAH